MKIILVGDDIIINDTSSAIPEQTSVSVPEFKKKYVSSPYGKPLDLNGISVPFKEASKVWANLPKSIK